MRCMPTGTCPLAEAAGIESDISSEQFDDSTRSLSRITHNAWHAFGVFFEAEDSIRDLTVTGVQTCALPICRDLAAAIRGHRPDLVLTGNYRDTWPGGGWNSPDHRSVGRAVLDAIADAGNRWIFPELTHRELPPWSGVRYVAVAGSPQPTHAVDVSAVLDKAVASLEAHDAYLKALGDHPMASAREFLEWMADLTAARFGGQRPAAVELVPT